MARGHFLATVVLLLFGHLYVATEEFIDPMPTMVSGNGYPLETHPVTTADGYILNMHRIPFGVKSPASPDKPVVFLMHPMYGSSYSFTFLGKDHSLAFILADAGYDVWLGNTRGNIYARSNIFVSTDSSAFWQFSWHERGTLDLPAMIDYVLDETSQEKLYFITMSRGGTMFFVTMAELPEYNDKIRLAVNMAPIVFLTHPHSALQDIMSQWSRLGEWISVFVGINEFHLTQPIFKMLDVGRCKKDQAVLSLCNQMFFITGSYDGKRINKTKAADIERGSTIGVSIKELAHFGQLITSKRFSKYNYAFIGNVGLYGSLLPPSYDLGKVTAPVVVINSRDDIAITTTETDILLKALPNVVKHILIEDPGFSHADFMASDDAKTIVYDKILDELKKY